MSTGYPLPGRVSRLGDSPRCPDRLDLPAHVAGSGLEPCGGHLPKSMRDEASNDAVVLPQRVGQSHDLLDDARRVRDRHQNRPVATFDLRCQRDFFVACQERNPAHVSQIQPHDVAGRVGPARGQVVLVHSCVLGIRSLERLRIDVDAGLLTLSAPVVQHGRRGAVSRQHGVDLLAEEVSLLLSVGAEPADDLVVRARRHGVGPVCS